MNFVASALKKLIQPQQPVDVTSSTYFTPPTSVESLLQRHVELVDASTQTDLPFTARTVMTAGEAVEVCGTSINAEGIEVVERSVGASYIQEEVQEDPEEAEQQEDPEEVEEQEEVEMNNVWLERALGLPLNVPNDPQRPESVLSTTEVQTRNANLQGDVPQTESSIATLLGLGNQSREQNISEVNVASISAAITSETTVSEQDRSDNSSEVNVASTSTTVTSETSETSVKGPDHSDDSGSSTSSPFRTPSTTNNVSPTQTTSPSKQEEELPSNFLNSTIPYQLVQDDTNLTNINQEPVPNENTHCIVGVLIDLEVESISPKEKEEEYCKVPASDPDKTITAETVKLIKEQLNSTVVENIKNTNKTFVSSVDEKLIESADNSLVVAEKLAFNNNILQNPDLDATFVCNEQTHDKNNLVQVLISEPQTKPVEGKGDGNDIIYKEQIQAIKDNSTNDLIEVIPVLNQTGSSVIDDITCGFSKISLAAQNHINGVANLEETSNSSEIEKEQNHCNSPTEVIKDSQQFIDVKERLDTSLRTTKESNEENCNEKCDSNKVQEQTVTLTNGNIGDQEGFIDNKLDTESDTNAKTEQTILEESKVINSQEKLIAKKMADIETQAEISNLKLQLNAAQQTIASLELEIHQKEEVIIKTQAEYMKSEQALKNENKQLKEKLKENSKIIEKDEAKDLEEALKEAQAREQKALNALNARTEAEAHYEKKLQHYERLLKEKMVDLQKHIEDHETVSRHLANIELAFSDVHQKYERTKAVLEGFKVNEETLRQELQFLDGKYRLNEEKYMALKGHAKAQIDKSNKSIMELKEKYDAELCKLRSIVKRLEIKCTSLETALEQKTKECDELSALCDDLTGKKV